MKITRERYEELGLGIYKESCECCLFSYEKNGTLYCEGMDISIDKAIEEERECLCTDEERLQIDMTDEEYYAYRHNNLEVQ